MAALALSHGNADAAKPTVGAIVVADGIKMRIERQQFPDRPDYEIFRTSPGWLAEASAKRNQILRDVRDVLSESDSDTVSRFTAGKGPAGLDREAHYAAWQVAGYWLSHGETFAEIAHVREEDAPARVAEAIDKMLAEPAR